MSSAGRATASSLRERVVQIAHRGHQGIVQTKRLIRARLWFPGIDIRVERAVRELILCQAAESDKRSYEPLKPSPMPEGPWQSVAEDFFWPLDGKYYFVNVCRYSRCVDVVEFSSLTGEVVTRQLRKLFIRMDAPLEYLSDNGPPFDSYVFDAFANSVSFIARSRRTGRARTGLPRQ